MDNFKILLVDDDSEQREQLQETIDNYNKKLFIEELKNKCVIEDQKYISRSVSYTHLTLPTNREV